MYTEVWLGIQLVVRRPLEREKLVIKRPKSTVAAAGRFVNTRSLPHNAPRLSKRLEIERVKERRS